MSPKCNFLLCLGVYLQLSPVNYVRQNFFLRPGGARAPSAPPGYACDHIAYSIVLWAYRTLLNTESY